MKTAIAAGLRLGKISYTNCIPFYHGLEAATFSEPRGFVSGSPAFINEAMHEGRIDVAPVSSLEYLNHQADYWLLPNFAIGAEHFSGSVLLFSREKIENLNQTPIALSRESLSSSALLKILLKYRFQFENNFVVTDSNPEKMLQDYPAALVIGDDALFFEPKNFIYKYDLSELWSKWTGKAFCFAVWAVRRQFAESNPEAVALFSDALKRNLKKNLSNLEALIQEAKGFSFLDTRFSKTFSYLSNLNYQLDETLREGLMLFYHWANKAALAPKIEGLEFYGQH